MHARTFNRRHSTCAPTSKRAMSSRSARLLPRHRAHEQLKPLAPVWCANQVNDPRTAEVFAPVWDKATNNWTVLDDVSMWYNEVGPLGKV